MVSIIIPTYNEGQVIKSLILKLRALDVYEHITEIIVCDGGSSDDTITEASAAGALIVQSKKGRAIQMNAGAAIAKGEILYFLHADTVPPKRFIELIITAHQKGYNSGCFTLRFDVDHWFLKANAYFTRYNIDLFRFGDQSLFVSNGAFNNAQGYNEDLIILEDQEIISRIKKYGKFVVINNPVTTSSRKYIANGVYKTQLAYFFIYILFKLGVSQHYLLKIYKLLIKQNKL